MLNTDALIGGQPETEPFASSGGIYMPTMTGFNPAVDILQVQSSQAANFGSLHLSQANGITAMNFGAGAVINLQGVAESALQAANFHFV